MRGETKRPAPSLLLTHTLAHTHTHTYGPLLLFMFAMYKLY